MTPHEVQGLQALAMKHGGSLTINPDTGLPEANFLKSLLPMLAGFALGPAGFGLVSSAMGAGAIVGGITGIATGSLSKGLMAGLGAYGGFGIGEGLMGAGADAMTRGALSAEGALPSIENITQVTGEGYGGSAANYSDQVNSAVKAARDASAAMPTSDLLSAGAKSAMDDPMGFAKQNWKPIAAAALPVLSAIGTTTPGQAPTPQSPGRIREKRWDGRQFVDVANTDASVYNTSGRSFSDLYRGYNTGGIVALAGGGDVPGYAAGTYVPTDAEIFNYFKTPGTKTDAQIAQDMQTYGVSAADIARATGTQGQQGNYEQRFVKAVATPATDASEFLKATQAVGLQNQGLATAMQGAGLSAADQYALTHNLSDATTNLGALKDTSFYKNLGYTTGTAPGDQGGLEGLYSNINNAASGLQKKIDAGTLTVADAQRAANDEMTRIGLSGADIKAATGQDLFGLFKPKTASTITGGTGNDTIVGATGNDTLKGGTGNDTIVLDDKTKDCPTGFHKSADGKTCVPNAPVIIDWKD
jgi:hypothetical protein